MYLALVAQPDTPIGAGIYKYIAFLRVSKMKTLRVVEKRPFEDKQNIFYTLDSLNKAAKFKAL